ncbi:hypothetical protein AOPFMNJM_1667 [Methylobacterium jeotgali]|uniref:Transporter n=3 Tax=Pseudomonadota TaxID=1224 RepID=A0ABQ4SXE9_9HYPH|nr:hypothetical protein [Methylobacterium jeotgali]GJE06351.1 hypothetical protein AOPFMNJM_1667 [Methylobacterium jeotgali]
MEFAASALTAMASAAGSVGASGVASAATAGASALTSASSALAPLTSAGSVVGSILSGSASLLQMSQLRQAGREKELSLNLQAADTVNDIARENLQQQDRSTSLRQALLQTIGERDAAYAASGVDLTFGTPAVAREQSVTQAEQALTMESATATSRVARLNERAGNLRLMARSARRSADTMADLTGLQAAGNLLRRG